MAISYSIIKQVRISKKGFLLYPTVAGSSVTVDMTGIHPNEPVKLVILDMLSRTLYTNMAGGTISQVPIDNLAPGVYILKAIARQDSYIQRFNKK